MAENALQLAPTFTETEAARKLGISLALLQRERRAGKVHPIRYGTRLIRYTDAILIEYQHQCSSAPDKSETSGSASGGARNSGAGHGTKMDRQDDLALLRRTLMKQKAG